MRVLKLYFFYALMFSASVAYAADTRGQEEPRMVTGMSVMGNDETPKALYMIPWRKTEEGGGVKSFTNIMSEGLKPINREEFILELKFYKQSNPSQSEVSK